MEGLERELETYNEVGVCFVLILEEDRLSRFQEQVRDLTRGRASLRVLEHFEN
ncbi:hypothetical protein [Meiothermus sp.]|uniref:hypothetical protein n=1 Tax=Meiothermus sp. TaxID=1955249 RepID=UPI00307DD644